jgi:hypothetical protein
MNPTALRTGIAALLTLMLSACTATKLTTLSDLPPPLIEKHPVRVGIHYSQEFREFVHRELRSQIDYEITLGPAHVTNLDWLLKAMFAEVVPVEDPARVADMQPPLVLVLEPKFEEYSFLTPKDVAGDAFIVTIRYLLTLYDGSGARVDAFTFTGYGREKAHTLASKEPLALATQRAMRDAGAKVAVELTDQEAVRLLLRNALDPLPAVPPVSAPAAAEPGPAEAAPAGLPPAESPPVEPAVESPPAGVPAAEEPPSTASG